MNERTNVSTAWADSYSSTDEVRIQMSIVATTAREARAVAHSFVALLERRSPTTVRWLITGPLFVGSNKDRHVLVVTIEPGHDEWYMAADFARAACRSFNTPAEALPRFGTGTLQMGDCR